MKFADLNSRDKNVPPTKTPPEKTAGRGASVSGTKTEPPLMPLDAPLPAPPGGMFASQTAEPAGIRTHSLNSVPAEAPGEAPDTRKSSRKDTHRRDVAAARAAERPFHELDASAREIYVRNLSLAKELLTRIDQPYVDKWSPLPAVASFTAKALPENPVILNYTSFSTADNYLYAHSANVAIISQAVGIAMGLEKSDVELLGFCALAHDTGMTDYADLANRDRRLTDEEYAQLTGHSEAGAAKLDRLLDMDSRLRERAKKVISQVHERIDGSGYPARLANDGIDLLSQILGLTDVYEAMTHPRAWRAAMHPHTVIKHLIDKEGKGFNSNVVKAIIKVLSIYPPGSLVALSNGEIARVVKVNKQSLTRPVVSVLLGQDFSPVPPRLLDLLEHPLSGINEIVEDGELNARNPKFAARMELSRWWVEW
jgi:HD-GYP domain-containing protein (c-di-GMP phosphodiesterase class II)